MSNQVSYQSNFTGIKYNNNPLAIDPNSFSNSNNVYLNKYGALISRSPIIGQTHPALAYSGTIPTPVNLKLVGMYDLVEHGIIYVIFNTSTNIYTLRHKSTATTPVYTALGSSATINNINDYLVTRYKQYVIVFMKGQTQVYNTIAPSWTNLSANVDIPITSIQTGNEVLTLPGNQFTTAYKKQFILKPDSDDTIYALPAAETASITFPSQTSVTYNLTKANEYTRDRVLRKLNTPSNNNVNALLSMVGEKIAIAHSDRVDISLDYGDTFYTVPYPTIGGDKYKNTASLSDDGQCFFYVHSNGVYRHTIGTEKWDLLEVEVDYSYDKALDPLNIVTSEIEQEVKGPLIDISNSIGANYCHFLNAEKFAFSLAYYTGTEWISTFYVKGLNMTNLFDQTLQRSLTPVNSFATVDNVPINVIGANLTTWSANPYLNKKLIRILDDINSNTVAYYYKHLATENRAIFLQAATTSLWSTDNVSYIHNRIINYVTFPKYTWTTATTSEINELIVLAHNRVKVLVRRISSPDSHPTYWQHAIVLFNTSTSNSGGKIYQNNHLAYTLYYATLSNIFNLIPSSTAIIHRLGANKYLCGSNLQIVDDEELFTAGYVLSFSLAVSSAVIVSGPNYLIYDSANSIWRTNIPIQTKLTYTYAETTAFNKVPTAVFEDQNLWLGFGSTLWIASLLDDKLSAPALNNNVFHQPITAIASISPTSKAIFFRDTIALCQEAILNDNAVAWYYYPLKFTVGVRQGDTVITTNDGKLTIFPTKYGLAALTYQLDIAATEQAITYLSDDIKTLWSTFYNASTTIKIIHHNSQLILANGTNQVLIYDLRTNGWYPLTMPDKIKVSKIDTVTSNYELLQLQPLNAEITSLTGLYQLNKEQDELYTYATPYKDFGTTIIPWHLTSHILLLGAPNNYKNIAQLVIDQMDSNELVQSAYLTTQVFRQLRNTIKPSIELVYNIDTFAKIVKKVNWWKVLGFKWQLENDAKSSYPTQLRLYNVSIIYDVSYEVK